VGIEVGSGKVGFGGAKLGLSAGKKSSSSHDIIEKRSTYLLRAKIKKAKRMKLNGLLLSTRKEGRGFPRYYRR
jgi:hypothetical protein